MFCAAWFAIHLFWVFSYILTWTIVHCNHFLTQSEDPNIFLFRCSCNYYTISSQTLMQYFATLLQLYPLCGAEYTLFSRISFRVWKGEAERVTLQGGSDVSFVYAEVSSQHIMHSNIVSDTSYRWVLHLLWKHLWCLISYQSLVPVDVLQPISLSHRFLFICLYDTYICHHIRIK